MNAMSFNNVVLDKGTEASLQTKGIDAIKVAPHPQLEPVIAKLAMLYPLWTFTGNGHMSLTSQDKAWLTTFEVSCDGEPLGTIQRRYESRDYAVCITNHRIKATMERGQWYKTKDPDKAIAKVKKMFGPRDVKEMVDSARELAASVAQSADWNKSREANEAKDIVQRAAKKYVLGAGFDTFMQYVKDNYPMQEYELLTVKHAQSTQAEDDLRTITKVREILQYSRKGAVVVQRGSTYVVEHNDKAEICDDNTLPDWIRNRIGMLKLIEPEQFVSDLGMRSRNNVFVMIEPEPTDVSEGETK